MISASVYSASASVSKFLPAAVCCRLNYPPIIPACHERQGLVTMEPIQISAVYKLEHLVI